MATIVVHGTMTWRGAQNYSWWFNSWGDRGFLRGLAEGMKEARGGHDVWHVGGRPVSDWQQLRSRDLAQHEGHFRWSGANMPAARDAGGDQLVDYLNVLSSLSDEPLRIVAHSHGCNLVKRASSHRHLSRHVFIQSAVFLACPHFAVVTSRDVRLPYRLDPHRFGGILGLACKDDPIQIGVAAGLKGGLEIHGFDFSAVGAEGFVDDQDLHTRHLYESYYLPTDARGDDRHSVIHGAGVGFLCGLWLSGDNPFIGGQSVPVIPAWDKGEG